MKQQIQEIKPNKYLQPFAHKQWEIVGHLLEFNDTTSLQRREGSVITFWKRFASKTNALIGLFLLLTLFLGSLIIPFFSGDPRATDVTQKYLAPGDSGYIFGTDQLGRDFWSYIWNGLRFSLALGLFAATVDFIVGVTMGLLMGHFPKFDRVMQYFLKIFVNIPGLLILLLATIAFQPTFWTFAFGLTITGWISMSINVRAQVLRAKNLQWVQASRFLGTPKRKVLLNYLPVVLPLIITQIVLTVSGTILAETSIAFIGLGIPNQPSLGSSITIGSRIILTFPRYTLIPSSFLVTLTLSLQLIAAEVERSIVRQR